MSSGGTVRDTPRGGQGEALLAWAVWTLIGLEIVVTYSRLPASQLYHVSHDGLVGGLSRVVVYTNYPMALVAIALVLIAADTLPRSAWWAAGPALALCAVTPLAVDPNDLDVRWINAVPDVGVLVAAGLTYAAVRREGTSFGLHRPWDHARIVIAAVVLVLSVPWFAADLGFFLPGNVFSTGRIFTEGTVTLPAVHHGHHHGLDGALMLLTALLLSRVRPAGRRVAGVLVAALGLMASYGLVIGAEDFWHEQIVKRGWVHARIPDAVMPSVSWVWLVVVVLAAILALAFWRERRLDAPATA
jgi:hypothetical protein